MSRHPRTIQLTFAGGEMSPRMFGRPDDTRFVNGAAKIQNMVCQPQGSLLKRPGSRKVRAPKNSATRGKLFPFVFSPTQSVVVEAGSANVSGRDIGHFRFHTNGGTLLYQQPARAYVGRTPTLDWGVSAANRFTTTASHDFQTGDPVVVTMFPDATSLNGTFQAVTPGSPAVFQVTLAAAADWDVGQQVNFADGGAGLPAYIGSGRLYWIISKTPVAGTTYDFTISATYQGTAVASDGTTASNVDCCAMPRSTETQLQCNRVYYARVSAANEVRLSLTEADALAGNFITTVGNGSGPRSLQYAYRPGDLVDGSAVGSGNYYCIREPWSSAWEPDDFVLVLDEDDAGHPPTNNQFWYLLPGTRWTGVTVNITPTNTIDVGVAHGLSEGDIVILDATAAPGGLATGTAYYVRNPSSTAFQVSATPYGSIITITSTGTAVNVLADPIYEVPHYYREGDLDHLAFAQSNDVLTIASPNHPPAELRRVSASRWEYEQIRFQAKAEPPIKPFLVEFKPGEGDTINVTTGAGELQTAASHNFSPGDPVYCTGLTAAGVSDEHYVVNTVPAVGSTLTLKDLDTGAAVTITPSVSGMDGRIRFSESRESTQHYYKVTAVADNGEESEPSEAFLVFNNLLVASSYTTIGWNAAVGAERYRIYKEEDGLYGLIGETEELQFQDDGIAPDLAVSPPILDDSLRRVQWITFDTINDLVNWAGHGFAAGTPVVFFTNDTMPGVEHGRTYYVFNPSADAFQITDTLDGTTSLNITGANSGSHWAVGGNFPCAVSYYEQRRVFAGSHPQPQDVWFTATGTESDLSYSIPAVDGDRVYFRIAAREASQVRHLIPLAQLVLLSSTAEFRLTPINDDAITPTSISIRPQSFVGADFPQPAMVNNNVIFAASRGGHVRELGFNREASGYLTGDLSSRAQHLFDGLTVRQIAYQKAPIPTLWFVSSNGKLLSLTYLPEEGVGAWAQHTTDGTYESVAIVPEGDEDAVYVMVTRNGVRWVERFADQFLGTAPALEDAVFLDNSVTYSGSPTTTLGALQHLNGLTVSYLADGIPGTATIANNTLTLPTAASKITVGLPFTTELDTVPLYAQRDAFASGYTKNISKVFVRVFESGAFDVGPLTGDLSGAERFTAGTLKTENVEINLAGTWDTEGQMRLRQTLPLPLTVLGLTLEAAMGN